MMGNRQNIFAVYVIMYGFSLLLQEYVDLYTDWLLSKSIEVQFKAFKKGFDLVIGDTSLVELFRPEEVELLVCGSKVSVWIQLEFCVSKIELGF